MSTQAPTYEDREMSIGRVFRRAFGAMALNPVVILGLALAIGALPGLLMTYFFAQFGLMSTTATAGTLPTTRILAVALVTILVSIVISTLVQAALTRATVSANEGRRISFGDSLSTALRVVLPLIGLSLLFSFGVAIGFVLLIVPGIILLLMWAVAVPTLVIERQGVFAAFSRSAELTKGARWKILGLFLVLVCLYWLLTTVLGIVGLDMYSSANAAAGLTTTGLIGTVLVGTLFNAVWGTIQPSLYVELREWKEGGSMESLEEIFA